MDRRRFLGLLLSTTAAAVLGPIPLGRPADAGPLDQGIGGTGMAPPAEDSDRGIGGTGVIGTIKKFGSIVVNDLRIAYPKDVTVRIDGRPASSADLRIGQVVRVTARGDKTLSTKTIDVSHEVVGPVDKVGTKQLTVLGQKVSTDGIKTAAFKTGDVVAVSGLRRNDGTIAASLVEAAPGAPSRLAGPLAKKDGKLHIGGMRVVGVDYGLTGQRVVLEGRQQGERFVATQALSETKLLPRSVQKLSIESYVERRGDSLRLGSGYAIKGGDNFDAPAGRSVRAVLQTTLGADGRLTVEGFRAGGRTYGNFGFGRGGGPGSRGPGGRGPGGRGSGGRGPGGRGPGGRGPGGGRGPFGKGFGGRGFNERGGFGGGRGRGGPMDFGRGGGGFDGGRGGGGFGGGRGGGGFDGGGRGGGGFGGGGGYGGGGGGGFGGGGGGGFGGGGGGFGGGGGGFGGGGGGFGGGGGGFGGGGGGFGGGGGGGRR